MALPWGCLAAIAAADPVQLSSTVHVPQLSSSDHAPSAHIPPAPTLRPPQDFLETLPLPEYCHPLHGGGLLNLAAMLGPHCNATDLGPKTYIALGRCEEGNLGREGDSVTKVHQDMSDAVNWMAHCQLRDGEGSVARCGLQTVQPPTCVEPRCDVMCCSALCISAVCAVL
jgi:hypothetical protein